MNVICVDGDPELLAQLRSVAEGCAADGCVHVFTDGDSACRYLQDQSADVAILTVRPPEAEGLSLAGKLRCCCPGLCVIFLSEYREYAFDAFEADAVGYGLLPCTDEKLRLLLGRAGRFFPCGSKPVRIRTIPGFSVQVNGCPLKIHRPKVRELLALMVDRGEQGLTTGEGISLLWPDRSGDENDRALFRVTYKRLTDTLREAGADCILCSEGGRRYIRRDLVDCDLYSILEGDPAAAKTYAGEYLREYSWAEDRNGQLYRMLLSDS